MFSWVKTAVSFTAKAALTIVNGVVTFVLIGGRVISSAAGAAFPLPNFVKLITNAENPYENPATKIGMIVTMLFNMIINFAVRVPAMLMSKRPKQIKDIEARVEENDFDDEQKQLEPVKCGGCFEGMNAIGGTVYVLATGIGIYSGFSASFSSINTPFTIATLFKNLFNMDDTLDQGKDEPLWKEYLIFGLGMAFFAANFYSFIRNNFVSMNRNAKEAALAISNGKIPLNKNVALALGLASGSLIAGPLLARFTTEATVENLEKTTKKLFNFGFNEGIKIAMIDGAPVSAASSNMLSYLPSIYKALNKEKKTYPNERAWERPTANGVFFIGIFDGVATTVSSFTAQAKFFIAKGLDWKNPGLIVFNVFTSSSTAIANLFFTSKEGFENTLRLYHESCGEQPYEVAPQNDNTAPSSPNFYRSPSSFTLFTSNSSDNEDLRNSVELDSTSELKMIEFEDIQQEEKKSSSYKCW